MRRKAIGRALLVLAALLGIALVAHGQGPNSVNAPSSLLDEYKGLETQWIAKLLGAAQRLFALLAGIEVAWSFTLLAIEKADFQLLTAAIIRKIMWIGIFYAVLLYGVTPDGGGWIPAILNSFQLLGQNASAVGPLGPSAIVGFGVNTSINLLNAASGAGFLENVGTTLSLVFCAVVIFLSYVAIAIQFVVALVESYLAVGAGVVLLGFGGSRWTAPYVERYISYAIAVGLKILLLYLLVGAGMTLSESWGAVASSINTSVDPSRTGFDLAAAAVMFLCVCWMSPKLASAILGGTTALSGGDLASVGVGLGVGATSVGMTAAAMAGTSVSALGTVQSRASVPNGRGPGGGGTNGSSGTVSPTISPGPPGSRGPLASVAPPGAASNPQPSPPSLTRNIVDLAERAFLIAEQTSGATRSALTRLRIPHDAGAQAPPRIPTEHGET
jgi:type IV secretion system protein TrbL